MRLQFFGAAGEVTGSCHILEVGGRTLLLDYGQIQGGPAHSERNREPFPFDATGIDAVILSHAHIDHCGRLQYLSAFLARVSRLGQEISGHYFRAQYA